MNSYLQGAFGAFFSVLCLFGDASGAVQPEYAPSFDPARGFKPAQTDLTEILLQLAGSLEAYSSPEQYLKHVVAEHTRIEGLYRQKFSKAPHSFRPAHLTDAYLDRLSKNWNLLAPKVGLDAFAQGFGRRMRSAVTATGGSGDTIVVILKQHQMRVFDSMAGKPAEGVEFASLREEIKRQLGLDRTQAPTGKRPVPRGEPENSVLSLYSMTAELFDRLDQGLSPEDANRVRAVLTSMIVNTGEMAYSELQIGIAEWAITPPAVTAYDSALEAGLSLDERKILASLLTKDHFTKAEFPALESFYTKAYERLSPRGRDELSRRLWGGMRR